MSGEGECPALGSGKRLTYYDVLTNFPFLLRSRSPDKQQAAFTSLCWHSI